MARNIIATGLALILVTLGLFQFASAAETGNVKIRVTDIDHKLIPFAIVKVGNYTAYTGPKGEPAVFNLAVAAGVRPTEYTITATHPLLAGNNGLSATQVTLKLTTQKPSANPLIRIRRPLQPRHDSSPPTLKVLSPSATLTQSATGYQFSVEADDPQSEVFDVTAKLDNIELAKDLVSGNTHSWSAPSLSTGNHKIKFSAWNNLGGSTVREVDFAVSAPASLGSVTGTAKFNNNPVANLTIKSDDGKTAVTDQSGVYTLTGLATGNRTITAQSTLFGDQAQTVNVVGNQTATVNFALIDKVAPAIPAGLTVSNAAPTTTKQTLTWAAVTDPSGVSYEVEKFDGTNGTIYAVAANSFDSLGLSPNTSYSYKVRALDKSNPVNTGAWSSVVSQKTQQLPTLSWVRPAANQQLSGNVTLEISYQAFGNTNVVKDASWTLLPNNTSLASGAVNSAQGKANTSWNTQSVANGNYTLRAQINDNEGNTATTDLAIGVNNPVASKGSIAGQISYAGNGLANVGVSSDDGPSTTTDSAGRYRLGNVTPGNRTITARINGLNDGTKTLTVTANQEATADLALKDTIAPTIPTNIQVTNQAPTTKNQKVTWTASTDFSGIKEYKVNRFTNGNNLAATQTVSNTETTFSNLDPNVQYSYTVTAIDNATNESNSSAPISATTQKQPIINWVAPAPASQVSGVVNLTISYSIFTPTIKNNSLTWLNVTDNSVLSTVTPTQTTNQMSLAWDTTTLSNGQRVLRATIEDSEGNTNQSDITLTTSNITVTKGDLTGKISDISNATGLAETTVELRQNSSLISSGKTDPNGNYSFTGVTQGTYSLNVTTEGYQDLIVNNVVINPGQTTTVNGQMNSLPRATFDQSQIRELAGPGRAFNQAGGLSIRPGTSKLVIGEVGPFHALEYDASTDTFVKHYDNVNNGGEVVAHDSTGFLIGRFSASNWVNDDGTTIAGPALAYKGLSPADDGSIYGVTSDKIFRFVNRNREPVTGWSTTNTVGTNTYGVAANGKNLFMISNNSVNSIVARIPRGNPEDASSVVKQTLGYVPGNIYNIPGTRSLAIVEQGSVVGIGTNRLRLIDSRTLQEYQVVNMPNNIDHFSGMTAFASGNSIKLYISSNANKVYIVPGLKN